MYLSTVGVVQAELAEERRASEQKVTEEKEAERAREEEILRQLELKEEEKRMVREERTVGCEISWLFFFSGSDFHKTIAMFSRKWVKVAMAT